MNNRKKYKVKKGVFFKSNVLTTRFLLKFSRQLIDLDFISDDLEDSSLFLKHWAKKLIIYAVCRLDRSDLF